jgi:hypothetical protein
MNSRDMAAKKTSKKPSKSDFIRSLPVTMSASEVVAKAKEAGIKIGSSLIYMVRGPKGGKSAPKKSAVKKPSSNKATPKKTTAPAAPGTAKSAGVSKSDFIRLHPGLSVAEVVAAGKDQGLSFSTTLVYAVRGEKKGKATSNKAASKKAPPTAKKTASKKATAAPTSGTSKADFVRARAHLSPKEIVEDAKAKGLKLEASYVYNVRGQDKGGKKARTSKKGSSTARTASTPAAKTPAITKPTASNGTRSSGSSVEDLLRAAAAELGLGKAIEILQGERARVRAVLGG